MNDKPIGIFDSGVGGLTVFKEIARLLPHENLIYLGDTARVPYGPRSKNEIIKFSLQLVDFLLKHDVKALVIACNTISSNALSEIRNVTSIPVIEVITPTVEQAVKTSITKWVGIMGTQATITSGMYQKLIKDSDATPQAIACPLLVPLIESGNIYSSETRNTATKYLDVFKDSLVDTIILGCTHYPLLKSLIKDIVGKNINVLDSTQPTAGKLKNELIKYSIENSHGVISFHKIYFTDSPKKSKKIISLLFQSVIKIDKIEL